MHCNQRSNDFDVPLLRARFDYFVEGFVIGRTAVRIARTVRLDRANVDLLRAQHFRPTDCGCQKMSVPERHVSDRNTGAKYVRLRHRDGLIGEGRTSDQSQRLVSNHQTVNDLETLADSQEALALPLLGALPVADVQG